jgi:hypothetical protein
VIGDPRRDGLQKRDTGRIDVPKAVLSRHPKEGRSQLLRAPPPPALAEHLQHFWSVRWDFRGVPPFFAHTLPHPAVHLIFELGEGLVYGLSRRPFRRELTGKDRVFGAKFRRRRSRRSSIGRWLR